MAAPVAGMSQPLVALEVLLANQCRDFLAFDSQQPLIDEAEEFGRADVSFTWGSETI